MKPCQFLTIVALWASLGGGAWASIDVGSNVDDSAVAASDQPAFEGGSSQATVDDLPTGEPNEAWHMPQPRRLQAMGIKTFGWVDQGITFNNLCPEDRWNGPVATNDRSNEYQLYQLWLGFERPLRNLQNGGWDIGGRIDMVYGSDCRYAECYGLETRFDSPNEPYPFTLAQFYGSVGHDDWTMKIGHFAPDFGYEVAAAVGNFFHSVSYALLYSEPVLVTGLEADYRLSEHWNLLCGFDRGWMMFEDNNTSLDVLAGLKWHSDETKTGLSFQFTSGPQDAAGQHNRFAYATVFKQELTDKLTYVAQHNLCGEEGGDPRTNGYARWYGMSQYLLYTINKKWAVGSRVEWFRDEEGGRIYGIGTVVDGWEARRGFCGTFTEATFGANWRPHSNVVVRPELRWDCYSGTPNIDGQLPFGDGKHTSQFLLATDVVVIF